MGEVIYCNGYMLLVCFAMVIIVDVRIRFTCIRSRGHSWNWWTSVKPCKGPICMDKVTQICFWQRRWNWVCYGRKNSTCETQVTYTHCRVYFSLPWNPHPLWEFRRLPKFFTTLIVNLLEWIYSPKLTYDFGP